MSFINRILSKAQRYAQQNPDKVRGYADKAARFADKRTKGKYRSQIDNAVRKVDGLAGHERTHGGPDPLRDDVQDPHRQGPYDQRPHDQRPHDQRPHGQDPYRDDPRPR